MSESQSSSFYQDRPTTPSASEPAQASSTMPHKLSQDSVCNNTIRLPEESDYLHRYHNSSFNCDSGASGPNLAIGSC